MENRTCSCRRPIEKKLETMDFRATYHRCRSETKDIQLDVDKQSARKIYGHDFFLDVRVCVCVCGSNRTHGRESTAKGNHFVANACERVRDRSGRWNENSERFRWTMIICGGVPVIRRGPLARNVHKIQSKLIN